MQKALTTLLMASLLSVVFSDLVIVASWKVNEVYIARFLCVERNMQESDCGGICYLTAQLEAQHSPTPEGIPLATLLEQSRSVVAMLPAPALTPVSPQPTLGDPLAYHDKIPSSNIITDIFHPPRV
jgi:hypothetical protein